MVTVKPFRNAPDRSQGGDLCNCTLPPLDAKPPLAPLRIWLMLIVQNLV